MEVSVQHLKAIVVTKKWLEACGMPELVGKELPVTDVVERAHAGPGYQRFFTVALPNREGPWVVAECRVAKEVRS